MFTPESEMSDFMDESCSLWCVCVLQPWAFQAREFLRKKMIGKEVCFTVEIKTQQGREYGVVYLGKGKRRLT